MKMTLQNKLRARKIISEKIKQAKRSFKAKCDLIYKWGEDCDEVYGYDEGESKLTDK